MQSTSSFRESPHQLHLSQDTGTGTALLAARGSWTAVAQWHRLAPAPESLRLARERILCRHPRAAPAPPEAVWGSHRCRLLFFSKLPGWPYNTCFSLFLFVFLYLWSSSTYVSWTNLWHPMHQGLMAVNVPVQDQLCYFSHFLEVSCL